MPTRWLQPWPASSSPFSRSSRAIQLNTRWTGTETLTLFSPRLPPATTYLHPKPTSIALTSRAIFPVWFAATRSLGTPAVAELRESHIEHEQHDGLGNLRWLAPGVLEAEKLMVRQPRTGFLTN